MTPSSGSATVASSSTICAEALRHLVLEAKWTMSRASRMISVSQPAARRRVSLPGAHDHAGDLGARRHIHLGPHRADLRDEPDHPFDLGIRLGVAQALVAGPVGLDQPCARALPSAATVPR